MSDQQVAVTTLQGKTYSTSLSFEEVEDCVVGGELVQVDGEDGFDLYVNPRGIITVGVEQAV